ncbi:HD domain-containing protein [Streptomyces sp. YU58]|uniref:HD domain-containing protein n=1 Tax=Streptomyces sp. SX92 TaxID=3158972 RepID=UPI0027BA6407|nr:HD domain-containing protein [Streptomyces coralus]WLW51584.1 HD domain-containing protein [Streptomyces coralus]
MTPPDLLHRALHDPPLRPLPDAATRLLCDLNAPPRLAAHLRAVHDVAYRLVDWMEDRHPDVALDREAVLFGAATHDIGKAIHTEELSGPGTAHEEAGRALLLARGVSPELARFAGTHASWTRPGTGIEDLLVSLADKIWKHKRVPELEDLVVSRLAEGSGRTAWEEFLALDDVLTVLGEGADDRLAFQSSYPVTHVS